MDSGTALIGLIFILICITPFALTYFNKVKKEKRMLKSLIEIGRSQQCTITQHEYCGDFILGIDEGKNFVFFFKQKKEEAVSQFVDLSKVQHCQVVKKSKTAKNSLVNAALIERIELLFLPANKSQAEIRLELYDEDTNMQLNGELQFVEKWSAMVNHRLKNKK